MLYLLSILLINLIFMSDTTNANKEGLDDLFIISEDSSTTSDDMIFLEEENMQGTGDTITFDLGLIDDSTTVTEPLKLEETPVTTTDSDDLGFSFDFSLGDDSTTTEPKEVSEEKVQEINEEVGFSFDLDSSEETTTSEDIITSDETSNAIVEDVIEQEEEKIVDLTTFAESTEEEKVTIVKEAIFDPNGIQSTEVKTAVDKYNEETLDLIGLVKSFISRGEQRISLILEEQNQINASIDLDNEEIKKLQDLISERKNIIKDKKANIKTLDDEKLKIEFKIVKVQEEK